MSKISIRIYAKENIYIYLIDLNSSKFWNFVSFFYVYYTLAPNDFYWEFSTFTTEVISEKKEGYEKNHMEEEIKTEQSVFVYKCRTCHDEFSESFERENHR